MKFQKSISYIFHPIIIPIVSTLLYFIIVPKHIPREFAYRVLGVIFIATYLIPILVLYFLKRVKLIESYQLRSINERKFPILFFLILSFLLGRLLLRTKTVDLLAFSFFACTLALAVVYALFFSKVKTSLHTLGISGLIGFMCIISYEYQLNILPLIIILFVLFGLIATSRLKLEAHKMSEVFWGFIIGFSSQLVVYLSYSF